jgi:hypothetical protein
MTVYRTAAILAALVLVPLGGAWADHRGVGPYGRMVVEGVVVSTRSEASTFVLRLVHPPQSWWREMPYLTVWVQRGTKVAGHPWPGGGGEGVQAGDRVRVDGFRLDDGRLLALEVDVRERPLRGISPGVVVVRGVVVARGPALIVIVDSQGTTRVILVVATTRLVGPRPAVDLLRPHDQVVVLGLPNADGTLVAREVQVVGLSLQGP